MSQASMHQPKIRVRGSALKLVVFGMPGSGKTSLLGALGQAAQTQQRVLGGSLIDRSGQFGDLRRQVYEGKPPHPNNDLTVYPLTFQPHEAGSPSGGPLTHPVEVVLFDCDGRGATEFLADRHERLSGHDSRLADSLLQSDALVLTVDASSRPEILRRDIGLFLKFLRLFQNSRADRTEVNGLPVYVVLTKCDQALESNDTPSTWMDRIEERKRKVEQYFHTQLEKEGEQGTPLFGAVRVHVWATALHRPAFANVASRPHEPYQVAELFRQCLVAALAFRRQRHGAERKLRRTLGGAIALACILLLLAGLFLLIREEPAAVQLENRIRSFLGVYNKASPERFRQAADVLPRLKKFETEPAFGHIDPKLRQWVDDERKELEAYSDYADLVKKSEEPVFIKSKEELRKQEELLKSLAPPAEYASDWEQSPAVKLRDERLREVKAIAETLDQVSKTLDEVLILARILKQELEDYAKLPQSQKVESVGRIVKDQTALGELASKLPDRGRYKDYPIRPGSRVTWLTIFEFPTIRQRYNEWEALQPRVLKPPL